MKKLLVLLMFVTSLSQADAGSAFVTGFANALNRSMGGNPADSQPQAQTVNVAATLYQPSQHHYDAIMNETGTRGQFYFFSYQECNRFLAGNGRGVYNECISLPD